MLALSLHPVLDKVGSDAAQLEFSAFMVKVFYKISYWFYRKGSGLRHRLSRRLTRAGWTVFWGAVATALMGLDTEVSVSYQAFTFLAFLLMVAVVSSWFFGGKFAAHRALPRFATAGVPVKYQVLITNLTGRNQAGLVLLEELTDSRPPFPEWRERSRFASRKTKSFRVKSGPLSASKTNQLKTGEIPAMGPKQQVEVTAELLPARRGMLHFNGVSVARLDTLGLCRALSRVAAPQSILVLPRRYLIPPVALPGSVKYQQGGVAMASNIGQSEEFIGLRDYRPGDPLRHIHWRSFAKAGKPVVREFEDEFFVRHALILDTFTDDPYSEIFEEAVSVAASFACTIRTQESLLDLLFVGPDSYCFTSGRGLAHSDQILEVLASVKPCTDKPFLSIEPLVLNHARAVSGCICVLLDWDEARRTFVQKLQKLGLPVTILIVASPPRAEELKAVRQSAGLETATILTAGKIEEGLARINA